MIISYVFKMRKSKIGARWFPYPGTKRPAEAGLFADIRSFQKLQNTHPSILARQVSNVKGVLMSILEGFFADYDISDNPLSLSFKAWV